MVVLGEASLSSGLALLDVSASLVRGMYGINLINFIQTGFLYYDTHAWTLGNECGF